MKRLLDKTWAKLTSFFLTLLFGTMTVLGGLGVGILVSCDVFLDGGAYMRETMYESQCSSAIHNAYYYLRGTMANAGLLADDTPSTDTSSDRRHHRRGTAAGAGRSAPRLLGKLLP